MDVAFESFSWFSPNLCCSPSEYIIINTYYSPSDLNVSIKGSHGNLISNLKPRRWPSLKKNYAAKSPMLLNLGFRVVNETGGEENTNK